MNFLKKLFHESKESNPIAEKSNPIAFFCMEYAIDDDANAYAGGLGILAMDYVMEAADQGTHLIALGLRYSHNPLELVSKQFEIVKDKNREDLVLEMPICDKIVRARVWERKYGETVKMYLIDTHIHDNVTYLDIDESENITSNLYDPDFYMRVKQQMVLGIGGVKLLNHLGIKPRVYHMNEGHTAFTALGVMGECKDKKVEMVGTKHTIFHDAGIFINKIDFFKFVDRYCKSVGLNVEEVFEKGKFELDENIFSTTKFMISNCSVVNAVSRIHMVYEKKVHPHSKLIYITNGVYKKRWLAEEWESARDLTEVKNILRANLVDLVKEKTGEQMDPNICTVVWARRFASYKRPLLLFTDIERLKKIVSNKEKPLQFIISGKAHKADKVGQEMIEKLISLTQIPEFKGKIVYLPNFALPLAKKLVKGADIWLNTPERGKEACGTSGIKASMNGALQCSISDGWVDEESWEDKGWILLEDNPVDSLYSYLENDIPNMFYNKKDDWVRRMKKSMDLVNKKYTTVRMLDDYIKKLY